MQWLIAMPEAFKSLKPVAERSRLGFLLLSLIFILMIVPLLERSAFGSVLWRIGITMSLIAAAVSAHRRQLLWPVGLLFVAIIAPAIWLTLFVDRPWLFLINCILDGAFFVAMAALLLTSVMRKHLATVHSIFGAACSYLLLGLAWAVVYLGIHRLDPTAFSGTLVSAERAGAGVGPFSQLVYFSFVTMSTLGYGDIVPRSGVAQTLAWMQSVLGQSYLAVIVAWLVSELPSGTGVPPHQK